MLSTTLEKANNDFKSIVYHTLLSHEEVSIASDKGAVVLLTQEDYESMQETLRLLSDKKPLKALLDAHQQRDNDEPLKSYNVAEVFSDLQN